MEQARAKKRYDALLCKELVGYLKTHEDRFDIIVSMDALIYFGELKHVCSGVSQALSTGGLFVFTLERSTQDSGYVLNPHGRYAHTQAYIEFVLTRADLSLIELEQCVTRKELGTDVEGWLCVAKK